MTPQPDPRVLFLVSQPRAGSTLTQRVLANHPRIHTTAEPWIMLAPLLAPRRGGLRGDYQPALAREAIGGFLDRIPGGKREYFAAARRFGDHLYASALEPSGKEIFLDKTPRYYLILEELRATFPEAKIIVLTRNPLAVMCSILETWILPKQAWHRFGHYWQDLLLAPDLLVSAMQRHPEHTYHLRYEDLLDRPTATAKDLCRFVGVPYRDGMERYGVPGLEPNWGMGDQTGVIRFDRPAGGNKDRWLTSLANRQVWRLASDYLAVLDPDTVTGLGYDARRLRQLLERRKPSAASRLVTLPLGTFVHSSRRRRLAGLPVAVAMTVAHRLADRARGTLPESGAR